MIVEVFGKVLREIREANHISQEKLAEHCDLDRTYISLLKRGLRHQQSQRSLNWLLR